MNKPGPFQYCESCKKNTNHNWVGELELSCNCCGKQHKVLAATKKIEALRKLPNIKTTEERVKEYNATHDDSKMRVEHLTPAQLQEKYGHLTEEVLAKKIGDAFYGESKSFVEKMMQATIEQYLEEKPKPTGWANNLR